MCGRMRFIFLLILFVSLFSATAYARTEICGDGVDNDAVGGDLACSAPDQDRDGYYSDGTGYNPGTDCDDTNRFNYPGIPTSSGCSVGQYRTCQSNGSYTGCANVSGFTCHSGSGQTYWVSSTGTTGGGGGGFASPWDWRCFSNSSLTCYKAPVPGDCFVFKAGVYTSSWGTSPNVKHVFISNKDGTVSNPITMMAAPGDAWWETGAGNGVFIKGAGTFSPLAEVIPLQFITSDCWKVSGFQITTNTVGFSNNGIEMSGPATGGYIFNNYIHDIDGEEDNNMGCIKLRSSQNGAQISNNLLKDCYERQSTTGDPAWNSENSSLIRSMGCDNFRYNDNVGFSTANSSMGISVKHGQFGAIGGRIDHNVLYDLSWDGIAVSGVPNIDIDHNYFDNVGQTTESAIRQVDLGSALDEFTDLEVFNNTSVNSPCFGSRANQDDHVFGSSVFQFYNNICSDNRATAYPSDGTRGFIRINFYGSDSLFTAMVPKISLTNNCYYNTSGTSLLFSLFGDPAAGPLGSNYFGLTGWQSATGLDLGSFYENPNFNVKGEATSTNCATKGWAGDTVAPPGTTTTSSTTSTTLPFIGLSNAFVPYLQ